jgi:hypothetical protein
MLTHSVFSRQRSGEVTLCGQSDVIGVRAVRNTTEYVKLYYSSHRLIQYCLRYITERRLDHNLQISKRTRAPDINTIVAYVL